MQQIGSFTTPVNYPPLVVNPEKFRGPAITVRRETPRRQTLSTDDIAGAYPEAVVASSDGCAWQDIRVVHLRHDKPEIFAPVSEQHCILVNLGVPLILKAQIDEQSFNGEVDAGQVAILPAQTSWSAEATGAQSRNLVLLYLRPFFVRNTAARFQLAYSEIGLKP